MSIVKLELTSLEVRQQAQILSFENQVGFEEIVRFVDKNENLMNFIPKYQHIIRNNKWPYSDSLIPSYDGFVKRFEETSLSYVAKAISLFDAANKRKITYVDFETAVLSEAARGREGKRSKIGLDNQQEILIDELYTLLQSVWTPELGNIEEKVNTLVQTILSGHSSASELPEKFIEYIEVCNENLTEINLETADIKSGGLVSKLLREFCCYSLQKFNKQLMQYQKVYRKLKAKATVNKKKREEKIKLTEQISNHIEGAGGNSDRFLKLIHEIDHLNFLNDNIDVKYSFKSWPGLIHYTIFAEAIQRTGETTSIARIGELLVNL